MAEKKPPTPAQLEARRKFSERSKQKAAERKARKALDEPGEYTERPGEAPDKPVQGPELGPGEQTKETIQGEPEYQDLQRQILELKQMLLLGAQLPQPQSVGLRGGQLIGSVEKYDLTPANYPDPRTRLAKEARLAMFAFEINYDLMWNVTISEYTTIDHVRTKEPKFILELGRKLFIEETGEPKLDKDGKQMGYIISRLIFHEDPDAALTIAREQNVDIDETDEAAFLNEMRYLRMRDWLLECFFPAPVTSNRGVKEMVVGGMSVETYAITSENSEKIPFDQIKGGMLRT